jgi:hypothetical protein
LDLNEQFVLGAAPFGPWRKTFAGGPFAAACGDGFVLRMTLVAAPSEFIELGVSADIP